MYGGFFPSRSGNAGDQKRKRNRFASLYAPCFADGGDSRRLRLYRHDANRLEFWRRQRVTTLAVYRFCAGGLVLRRDAGGSRGDGTRHLVDGAKLSATAIACALYGFCWLRRDAAVFKWSGGALSLVWLCALVGAVALFYTGYLLYLGIPTFLNINREEGLSFSSSTLAIGVLVLEVLLAITVILWGYGYRLF